VKSVNVIAITMMARGVPVMLMGALSENALHIIELKTLPASIPKIREYIDKLMANLAAGGEAASVFIEDPTGLLRGTGGYQIRLDDKATDGRPLLAVAMERYRAMVSLNGLTYPKGNSGEGFTISSGMMNIKMGDNGRAIYEIDWENLKDGSRALLLLIYGAMCQGPMQADYLNRMYAHLASPGGVRERTPTSSFLAATSGFDLSRSSEFPSVAKLGETL
jgi:hypothetical protein